MPTPDEAARSSALFVPRPDLGTLVVSGPDRLEWLQGVLTSDVSTVSSGPEERRGSWALSLTKQGKILSDVLVVADDVRDVTLLGIPKAVVARTLEWLQGFLIMEDADLADATDRFAWATVHGPASESVAVHLAADLDGASARVEVTGLGDAALVVPASHAEVLAERAPSAGAVVAGVGDYARLRVERLVPLYGVDMDDQRNPHEASLDRRCVSWTKGCYLGQEAVCMLDMRGKVKRRLVLLRLEAATPPPVGSPVTDPAGTVVGESLSGAESHLWGGAVALARIATAAAETGTRLRIGETAAEVVAPNR